MQEMCSKMVGWQRRLSNRWYDESSEGNNMTLEKLFYLQLSDGEKCTLALFGDLAQSFDQNELKIIVIDRGSTDETRKIACKYQAVIYDNPKRLPEYAKAVGTDHATGHYIIGMDSDEEFSYRTQLQDKMDLKKYQEVKMLITNRIISGYRGMCGIFADYMNTLGAPFFYFVYHTKADKYATYLKHVIEEEDRCVVMKFEPYDIYPLEDSAVSVLSLDYMRDTYSTIEFICGVYDRIMADTKFCGCIKGDTIRSNCSSSFKTYLSKLKFRVINNLFHNGESGFSAKEELEVSKNFILCICSVSSAAGYG